MPESNQPASPPPAYINHGDVSATHIEISQPNPERDPTAPISPQTSSIAQEIAENQVLPTRSTDKQDDPIPATVMESNTVESTNTNPDKLLSKLELVIERLESSQEERLITRLETVLSRQAEADANASSAKRDTRKPIKLKDAVGRRFSFPYHRCETWAVSKILIP